MKQTSDSLRYFLIISALHFDRLSITYTQQKRAEILNMWENTRHVETYH